MTGDTPAADATTVQGAVREIRREGYKAAALHAAVDAVVALLVVNLAGIVAPVDLPTVGPAPTATLAGIAAALVVLVAEFRLRTAHYTVERFEADNPVVAEALRTARDAADDDADSTMARRLYGDVTDRLSETSSLGFVQTPWLAAGVVLVVVLGVATVQATAVGFTVTVDGGDAADSVRGPVANPDADNGTTRLRDGDDVLGEVKDVPSGTEELDANVSAAAGGQEGDETHDYGDRGLPDDSGIGAERAGFDEQEEIADADLVREYNLRLQSDDDE